MAAATVLCLVATGGSMADPDRFGKLAFFLFSLAWLVFYVSATMPIRLRLKKRSANGD